MASERPIPMAVQSIIRDSSYHLESSGKDTDEGKMRDSLLTILWEVWYPIIQLSSVALAKGLGQPFNQGI